VSIKFINKFVINVLRRKLRIKILGDSGLLTKLASV
jgi:hypothetical protein